MTRAHLTPSSAKPFQGNNKIETANGDKLDIVGTDNLTLFMASQSSFHLPNVFLVPKLTTNLISVGQLVDDFDHVVSFSHSGCAIQDRRTGIVKRKGRRIGCLFALEFDKGHSVASLSSLFVSSNKDVSSSSNL
ncbi:hypothetical protein SLA2020_032450 [Shorea laevis]